MKSADSWFAEYGESHENALNKAIHWICVPSIMFSLLGMIGSIPEPVPGVSLPLIVMALAVLYYFILSPALGVGMLLVSVAFLGTLHHLANAGAPILPISIAIFVAAWVGQFIGHKIEGKKPSFFKDIQFLLIGPVWLLSALYRRVGIRY